MTRRRIALIGQPFDSGGMGRGSVSRSNEVKIARLLTDDRFDTNVRMADDPGYTEYEIRRTFDLNRRLAALVAQARRERRFPLILAGNCNSRLGTVVGLAEERLAVAWFDAHADFDVPADNLSGFFDTMALASFPVHSATPTTSAA